MEVNQTFFEEIKALDTAVLVKTLKYSKNFTGAQEGIYILQIMSNEGFTRHKEVAELLGVSRSYISLRIKEAKEEYKDVALTRPVGRPKHITYELEEIHGSKVPLRLISKVGELPASEMTKMLMQHMIYLNKTEEQNAFENILGVLIESSDFSKEMIENIFSETLKGLE